MARRVMIDTELLVLLIVGLFDPRHIARHRNLGGRDRGYSAADFDLLTEWLAGREWVVTPNLLSEASNLVRQTGGPLRDELTLQIRMMAGAVTERYTASRLVAERAEFGWLGLVDTATLASLDGDTLLLTADGGLYAAAWRAGFTAVDFSHLRAARA